MKGKRLVIEQRRAVAAELRARGATLAQIAAQTGVSVPTAHRDVQAALRATAKRLADATDVLRAEGLQRCRLVVRLALRADPPDLGAILRAQREMSRLLGLDAPDRLAVDLTAPPVPVSRFMLVSQDGTEEEVDPGNVPEDRLGGRP